MKTNTAVSKALKITKAKTQLYTHSTVFYVSSESNPEEKYIVVKTPKGTFCQCVDFITRRLPLFGTPAFTCCKHILAVNTSPIKIPVKTPVSKKQYGVWFVRTGHDFRSIDTPGTFYSRAAATRAITSMSNCSDYEIRSV